MEQTERDAMRKLAEAATKGTRHTWVNNRNGGTYVQLSAGNNDLCCRIEIASTTQADIDFIAATDPAKVIELLDAMDAQAQRIVELEKDRDEWKDSTIMANQNAAGEEARRRVVQLERDTLRAELDAIKAQEPVAARWPTVPGSHKYCGCKGCVDLGGDMELLYAAQVAPAKPAQPLTDEQIMDIAKPFIRKIGGYSQHEPAIPDNGAIEDFARSIEAHIKGQA